MISFEIYQPGVIFICAHSLVVNCHYISVSVQPLERRCTYKTLGHTNLQMDTMIPILHLKLFTGIKLRIFNMVSRYLNKRSSNMSSHIGIGYKLVFLFKEKVKFRTI